MTWEDKLRQNLLALKGNRPMRELARDTGVNSFTLYKILADDRGIGSATLETLRQTQPDLVAEVFLPDDSPVGDSQDTIVVDCTEDTP